MVGQKDSTTPRSALRKSKLAKHNSLATTNGQEGRDSPSLNYQDYATVAKVREATSGSTLIIPSMHTKNDYLISRVA